MKPEMGSRARQTGATLVVALILLLVLTVLGVSGVNTARMEVAMAGSSQFQNDAFEAAENGIDLAIGQASFTTAATSTIPWTGNANYDRQSVTTFVTTTPVLDAAFSGGVTSGTVQAFHFDVVSVGKAARSASATHNQSFYVVGPGGP